MLGRRQTQTVILLSLDTGSKSHMQEFGSFIVLFLALYNSTMHTTASDWVVLYLKLLIDSGSLTRQVHIILICMYCCLHQMRQIGHVTCDNASNNDTMVEHLETLLQRDHIEFSPSDVRMQCMPHTVHLAALEVLT